MCVRQQSATTAATGAVVNVDLLTRVATPTLMVAGESW